MKYFISHIKIKFYTANTLISQKYCLIITIYLGKNVSRFEYMVPLFITTIQNIFIKISRFGKVFPLYTTSVLQIQVEKTTHD